MRMFRRNRGVKSTAAAAREPETAPVSNEIFPEGKDDSDVFVTAASRRAKEAEAIAGDVTLFVYAWHSVEPGPLSWCFPSLRSALDAVQRMKNAIGWSIVSGKEHATIDDARAAGAVLIEQLA